MNVSLQRPIYSFFSFRLNICLELWVPYKRGAGIKRRSNSTGHTSLTDARRKSCESADAHRRGSELRWLELLRCRRYFQEGSRAVPLCSVRIASMTAAAKQTLSASFALWLFHKSENPLACLSVSENRN